MCLDKMSCYWLAANERVGDGRIPCVRWKDSRCTKTESGVFGRQMTGITFENITTGFYENTVR